MQKIILSHNCRSRGRVPVSKLRNSTMSLRTQVLSVTAPPSYGLSLLGRSKTTAAMPGAIFRHRNFQADSFLGAKQTLLETPSKLPLPSHWLKLRRVSLTKQSLGRMPGIKSGSILEAGDRTRTLLRSPVRQR